MLDSTLTIRAATPEDMAWAKALWTEQYASHNVVSRGVLYNATELPAFAAIYNGAHAGIVTYHIDGAGCELVTLDSVIEGIGAGTALIEAVREAAQTSGCTRLWLITSNDNLDALKFYQKRGFQMVAIYPNAIDAARLLKPEIPFIGDDDIPIRDEIELEIRL